MSQALHFLYLGVGFAAFATILAAALWRLTRSTRSLAHRHH